MKLVEKRYTAQRGECADTYQTLEVEQETGAGREYIRFKLMEQRWRDPKEAAAYLRWAAGQLETLAKQ